VTALLETALLWSVVGVVPVLVWALRQHRARIEDLETELELVARLVVNRVVNRE